MTTVKHFHSAMSGAPAINITAGSLIAILDACLVNGFNLKTVDSIVVTDNVATVNMSTGAGAFEVDTIALIAGATPAGLNGEKRILSTTTNTITFATSGISNQTATGTITARLAPAGWEKPFSGTNLAVYRSADVTGTRDFLRLDDTGTTNARVVGYEMMTDVNTGTGAFPTAVQISGGLFWSKANAGNKAWTLIADGKTFWLWTHANATLGNVGLAGVIMGFGDFASTKSGDAYACMLQGQAVDRTATTAAITDDLTYSSLAATMSSTGAACARSFTGLGGSTALAKFAESYALASTASSGNGNLVATYPNGPDNSLLLCRMGLMEGTPALRGYLRGVLYVGQTVISTFNWRDKVDGQGSYSGRKLIALKTGGCIGGASNAVMFFDITGPWA